MLLHLDFNVFEGEEENSSKVTPNSISADSKGVYRRVQGNWHQTKNNYENEHYLKAEAVCMEGINTVLDMQNEML